MLRTGMDPLSPATRLSVGYLPQVRFCFGGSAPPSNKEYSVLANCAVLAIVGETRGYRHISTINRVWLAHKFR